MKKKYMTHIATEEIFAPNNYIASCQIKTSSTSTANKMQCINPTHTHSMPRGGHYYFAGVWVEADMSGCNIVINPNTNPKTDVVSNNNSRPAYGATVYGLNQSSVCTRTYNLYGTRYYVPANVEYVGCYGSYRNNGTYDSISQKVNS